MINYEYTTDKISPYTVFDPVYHVEFLEFYERFAPFIFGETRDHLFNEIYKHREGEFAGDAYIAGDAPGLVTVDGLPAAKEIELRARSSRRVVDVTTSKQDGTYRFDSLNRNYEYDLIARDDKRIYNDIIIPAVVPWAYKVQLVGEIPQFSALNPRNLTYKVTGGAPPYEFYNHSTHNFSTDFDGTNLSIDFDGEGDGYLDIMLRDANGVDLTYYREVLSSFWTELLKLNPYFAYKFEEDTKEHFTGIEATNHGSGFFKKDNPLSSRQDGYFEMMSGYSYHRIQAAPATFPASYDQMTLAILYRKNLNDGGNYTCIAQHGDPYLPQSWQLRILSDRRLEFVKISGSTEFAISNFHLEIGVIYAIVITIDQSGRVLMRANELQNTFQFSPADYGNAPAVMAVGGFGGGQYPAYNYHSFANYGFITRAITDEQVDALISAR